MDADIQDSQREFIENKKQIDELAGRIEKFLEVDLQSMTRFNARNMSDKLNQPLTLGDAWLHDLDEKYRRRKIRINEMLQSDGAKDTVWANAGNPFYSISQESVQLIGDADIMQELLFIFQKALLSFRKQTLFILDSIRDSEIESIKLEKEKELVDAVTTHYKEELKETRSEYRQDRDRMMDQSNQLTTSLQESLLLIKQIGQMFGIEVPTNSRGQQKKPEQPETVSNVLAPDDVPEGEITEEDKKAIAKLTKADAVAYLDKKYPRWKTVTFAKILETDPTYVSAQRKRKL